jgi:hypothetical protein
MGLTSRPDPGLAWYEKHGSGDDSYRHVKRIRKKGFKLGKPPMQASVLCTSAAPMFHVLELVRSNPAVIAAAITIKRKSASKDTSNMKWSIMLRITVMNPHARGIRAFNPFLSTSAKCDPGGDRSGLLVGP